MNKIFEGLKVNGVSSMKKELDKYKVEGVIADIFAKAFENAAKCAVIKSADEKRNKACRARLELLEELIPVAGKMDWTPAILSQEIQMVERKVAEIQYK